MRLRKRYLPLVAVLGAALAVIPAMASSPPLPSETRLQVNENCVENDWPCWTAETSVSKPQPASRITIADGGEVEFADHASTAASVNWIGGGAAPACTGVPTTASTGWEGTCKFEQPGTYGFESSTLFVGDGLDYTKYEVVVDAASTGTTTTGTGTSTTPTGTGTTTTPTTTTPTTTTTTTTPTTPTPTTPSTTQPTTTSPAETGTGQLGTSGGSSPVPAGSPQDSLQGGSLRLPASQSSSVHGSIQVAQAGSRLEIDLLATSASIATAAHATGVLVVGRLVKAQVPAGRFSFKIAPTGRARRALARRGHLALTVEIVLTPPHGTKLTRTLEVSLHR